MATKEYLISDGPILTEGGVLYRTKIVHSCFCCRRRTLTGRLSSLTVYWREHWPRWDRVTLSQSGNVLYTYTKRFAWVSVLMTRRVFAESVLLSQFCWVSYLLTRHVSSSLTDNLLMWTVTAAGPRDAESWFRAETYYIRIPNVSPESVFWWRGALLPSQFLLSQFCWVSYLLTRHVSSLTDSLMMWTLTAAVAEGPRDAESWFRAETYYIRILNVSSVLLSQCFRWQGALLPSQFLCVISFCWVSFAESVFAESDKARYCWLRLCVFTCLCMCV